MDGQGETSQLRRALAFLDSLVDLERLRYHPGAHPYRLDRMRALLEAMGLPRCGQRFVQIVGSKGKSSTAVFMESVLAEAGCRVGLFVKPHLFSPLERIRLDRRPVDQSLFAAAAAEVERHADHIAATVDGRLTYFEAITAMAVWCWAEAGADLAILEAGLGGRLDATTALGSVLTLITHIGLEHTDVLGHTLEAIAAEKAAVIRQRGLVVSAPQQVEAGKVIAGEVLKKSALFFLCGADFDACNVSVSTEGTTFDYRGIFDDLPGLRLPLLGAHQAVNAAVALAGCECLRDFCDIQVTAQAMRDGLADVEWEARVQLVRKSPPVIVDGAHTACSAEALAEVLRTVFPNHKAIFVLGVSADKDLGRILAPLAPLASRVIATQSSHPRALPAEEIAAAARATGLAVDLRRDSKEALDVALESAGSGDLVCVTGSLFLAAEALAAWREREGERQ